MVRATTLQPLVSLPSATHFPRKQESDIKFMPRLRQYERRPDVLAAVTPVEVLLVVTVEAARHPVLTNPDASNIAVKLSENIVYQCWERLQIQISMMTWKRICQSARASPVPVRWSALMAIELQAVNDTRLLALMGELEDVNSGSIYYDNVAPCFLAVCS